MHINPSCDLRYSSYTPGIRAPSSLYKLEEGLEMDATLQ
jgi:hypothetical protein